MNEHITSAFYDGLHVLSEFIDNKDNLVHVSNIALEIANCFRNSRKVMIAGNGGSACDAMHFAEEFTGKYRDKRRPLPVISFNDPGHITCVSNDFGFDEVFKRNIEAFGQEGDIFIALSTSGNSENLVKAVNQANLQNLKTIGLLGKDGGSLVKLCDENIIVPGKTSDRIQELHMMILHILIEGVERELFPANYT